MRVLISTPTLVTGDAVGNDCLQQYKCLKDQEIETYLYAEHCEKNLKVDLIPEREISKFLRSKDVLLIYHHSILWENGMELYSMARGKRVLKYHNITPSHFFVKYSPIFANNCIRARAQNFQLYHAGIDMLWGDSSYNNKDFLHLGLEPGRQKVLPPFHRLIESQGLKGDISLLEKLNDGKTNVLFVGRVVPNKGHVHIIKTAQYFRSLFGADIRFIVAGALDRRLGLYYQELASLTSRMGLNGIVSFTGKVTDMALKACYMGAHVFLSMSEHEGFCVPILESQHFKVPIVALNWCAVKETLGENQIAYDHIDYELFASAIHTIRNDIDMKLFLTREGTRNLDRFSYEAIRTRFLDLIKELS